MTTNKRRHRAIAQTSLRLPMGDLIDNVAECLALAVDHYGADSIGHASWYAEWSDRLAELADETGYSHRTTVGVFAALSPSTDVDRNFDLARTMLDSGDCRHAYGDAIRKARRIREGEDPADVLGGPKVRSFFANLMGRGKAGAVTIDRHAFSIAMGAPVTDTFGKLLGRPGAYAMVAAAYRAAGHRFGLTGAETQALTWVYWREAVAYGPGSPIPTYSLSQGLTTVAG